MKKIDAPEKVIFMCDGKKCGRYNKLLRKCFKEELKEARLKKDVDIVRMECTDNCKQAPVICLQPQNVWLAEVNEKTVPQIVKEYF